MFNPLSPRSEASINFTCPPTFPSAHTFENDDSAGCPDMTVRDQASGFTNSPSSLFDSVVDQENQFPHDRSSPLKEWSPMKGLASSKSNFQIHEDEPLEESTTPGTAAQREENQLRVSSTIVPLQIASVSDTSPQRQLLRENSLRNLAEQEDDTLRINNDEDTCDVRSTVSEETCFTTFSAVPNADMTLFATLGNRTAENTIRSPTRHTDGSRTPRGNVYSTPATSRRNDDGLRSSSPTPRRQQSSGDTTNLLLDFTGSFTSYQNITAAASPTRRGNSPSKSHAQPELLSFINGRRNPSPSKSKLSTPGSKRSLLNLLDFDLPPQPTPRSIPTITVRELESLKSTYLSEISSLKASLSGKEAEVESLKTAVGDAERRVGEALETVRDEKNAREHAEKEKAEWEKKGREVEAVLKTVREEFLIGEKEKEDLINQLEESNQKREEAELRGAEMSTMFASSRSDSNSVAPMAANDEIEIARRVAKQLDEKMENLARELHAVYKKKHETKVGTLKKTYEARSEKKMAELRYKLDELTKQNEELQAAKDATLSDTVPSDIASSCRIEGAQRQEAQKTELEEQRALIAGLREEIKSVKDSHEQLMQELEAERIEKGELVAAVDEMLALQSEAGAPAAIEDLRKSISRPTTGLKAPTESKIGRIGPAAMARSTSGSSKSKILSNIERMGQW